MFLCTKPWESNSWRNLLKPMLLSVLKELDDYQNLCYPNNSVSWIISCLYGYLFEEEFHTSWTLLEQLLILVEWPQSRFWDMFHLQVQCFAFWLWTFFIFVLLYFASLRKMKLIVKLSLSLYSQVNLKYSGQFIVVPSAFPLVGPADCKFPWHFLL